VTLQQSQPLSEVMPSEPVDAEPFEQQVLLAHVAAPGHEVAGSLQQQLELVAPVILQW